MIKAKKILICSAIILISSCSSEKIYYKYNDVTITRIDNDGEIKFYYGDFRSGNTIGSFVKVEYSGFDSFVDAFLLFNKDGSVEVVSDGGGYITNGNIKQKDIYSRRYEHFEWDSIIKSNSGSFKNIIKVSNLVETEKKINIENNTDVKAIYR